MPNHFNLLAGRADVGAEKILAGDRNNAALSLLTRLGASLNEIISAGHRSGGWICCH